jgi:FAD/FMN-containing dehydrogenase
MTTVTARTTEGGVIELERKAIDDFGGRLRGTLLLSGDPGYDDARSIWNAMIDRRPALIARCLGVADVVACVNFAREQGLAISIKGGGHNISSCVACLWTRPRARPMRRPVVSSETWTARPSSTALPQGFVSNTGIAGLTLGGGFGYLTRRFGWTCDTVLSMDVVTADGTVVRASERENPDLFWGLRGGGGNFGILTSIEYKLHPVGPEIIGGAIAWRGEDAPGVLEMYRTLTEQAPPELTCVAVLRPAPPAPWLSKEVHGKPIVALFVCYTGPVEEGEKRVAPIKKFGKPVGDIIQRRPYVSQQSLLDATQPKGRRYYWKSEYLPRYEPEMLAKLIEHAGRIVSPHSAIVVFPLDGALNLLPDDYSPMGNRDTASVLNITASWESIEDDQANMDWARTAWQDMRRFSTGGTYINFLTEEEDSGRIQDAYRKTYGRLVEVKTKWDPKNLFRRNKNIAPRKP